MGAVRVKVKLSNAADEHQFQSGQLALEQVRTLETDALVDTGAVTTIIPDDVRQQLGLLSRGQRVARYADGRRETVDITEPLIIQIGDREASDDALVLGDEVLIGQTVLEKMDLHVDCNNQKLTPNPKFPDYPVIRV